MTNRRWIACFAFFAVFAYGSSATSYKYKGWQAGPWKEYKTKDGMTMYLNEEVPSGVDGVRVDTIVDMPASKLFPVLMDADRQREYTFIREFKVISHNNKVGYLYQRVRSTGIQDRDFTVKLVLVWPETENGGPYGWIWEQANEKGPAPRDGIVRANVVSGSYVLTPLANGTQTRISYRLWFDPSSWVPDFLINGAVRDAGFETVRELRRAAEQIQKTGTWKE